MALCLTIRMCLLGRRGYRQLGELCLAKAEYLKGAIRAGGFETPFTAPTFNEFVVRRKGGGKAGPMLAALGAQKIIGGIDLGRWFPEMDDCFLVAVTERHTRADLDRFTEALKAIG